MRVAQPVVTRTAIPCRAASWLSKFESVERRACRRLRAYFLASALGVEVLEVLVLLGLFGAGLRGLEISRRAWRFVRIRRAVVGEGKVGGGCRRRVRRCERVGVWVWWKEGRWVGEMRDVRR